MLALHRLEIRLWRVLRKGDRIMANYFDNLKSMSLVDKLKTEIEYLRHHELWGIYCYSITSGRMTTLLQDALDQLRRQ